jgi:allantoinase
MKEFGASGHNVLHWSPFQDMDLTFLAAATFLRGNMIFDRTKVAAPGGGQFVRPARAGSGGL